MANKKKHCRPTRFNQFSSVSSLERFCSKIFVRFDIYTILHSKLYFVAQTCCFVRENVCVFGESTYFADERNVWTSHALQSVVQISEKMKIFVQECMRLKTYEQPFTTYDFQLPKMEIAIMPNKNKI